MHRLHSALLYVGVPADVVQISSASIEELARHEAFHAYAFCGQAADVIALNTQLAQRDGMLAQLIAETDFNA
jgi:delta 1-pyrroline-5-carboxylate dehydrogenase